MAKSENHDRLMNEVKKWWDAQTGGPTIEGLQGARGPFIQPGQLGLGRIQQEQLQNQQYQQYRNMQRRQREPAWMPEETDSTTHVLILLFGDHHHNIAAAIKELERVRDENKYNPNPYVDPKALERALGGMFGGDKW
jgi:hypothetical protein